MQIEECDKDKRRVLKKIVAEHTSKSKMKEKMLVRTQDLQHYQCGMNSFSLKQCIQCRFIILCINVQALLTPSTPAGPNFCCSKSSMSYWSNPQFLIFDIRHPGAQDWAPECPNVKI